jgi:hypothetical protein
VPDDSDDLPSGLVFSSLREDAAQRRRTLAVVAVVAVAGLALVWPVYPSVASIRPYVLGLPFSLAWVVGWLGVVFVALVLLYRADERRPDA